MSGVALCVWKLIGFRKTKCVYGLDTKNGARMMTLQECRGNGSIVSQNRR